NRTSAYSAKQVVRVGGAYRHSRAQVIRPHFRTSYRGIRFSAYRGRDQHLRVVRGSRGLAGWDRITLRPEWNGRDQEQNEGICTSNHANLWNNNSVVRLKLYVLVRVLALHNILVVERQARLRAIRVVTKNID